MLPWSWPTLNSSWRVEVVADSLPQIPPCLALVKSGKREGNGWTTTIVVVGSPSSSSWWALWPLSSPLQPPLGSGREGEGKAKLARSGCADHGYRRQEEGESELLRRERARSFGIGEAARERESLAVPTESLLGRESRWGGIGNRASNCQFRTKLDNSALSSIAHPNWDRSPSPTRNR